MSNSKNKTCVTMVGQRLLHHGSCMGEFEPQYMGTDYFMFRHKPCVEEEKWHGHSLITAVLIDNDGRIIFNLKCRSCGKRDALKTHPSLWVHPREKPFPHEQFFKLSPKLKGCVKRHWWDNL
jgi:hypothetical protein